MRTVVIASGIAAALLQASCAQAPSPPKPPSTTVDIRMHNNTVECFPDVHRCIIPVYVHADANGTCRAQIDASNIIVPKKSGPTIKVVWVLKKGDRNTPMSQFSFLSDGVKPLPAQPTDQFTSEGFDGTDAADPNPNESNGPGDETRRFRWASRHPVGTGAGKAVHYVITVQRTTNANGTQKCTVDPTISNLDN